MEISLEDLYVDIGAYRVKLKNTMHCSASSKRHRF